MPDRISGPATHNRREKAEVEAKAQTRTVRSSLSFNLNLSLLQAGRLFSILLDAWRFHPSCKVDIHLLFFAAPSDSRNIYRSSSKE